MKGPTLSLRRDRSCYNDYDNLSEGALAVAIIFFWSFVQACFLAWSCHRVYDSWLRWQPLLQWLVYSINKEECHLLSVAVCEPLFTSWLPSGPSRWCLAPKLDDDIQCTPAWSSVATSYVQKTEATEKSIEPARTGWFIMVYIGFSTRFGCLNLQTVLCSSIFGFIRPDNRNNRIGHQTCAIRLLNMSFDLCCRRVSHHYCFSCACCLLFIFHYPNNRKLDCISS